MRLVFGRMRVYLKAAVAALLLLFSIVFLLANYGNRADVWFVRQFQGVATAWVVLLSGVAGVLFWKTLWWLASLPGQIRQLKGAGR